MSKQLIINAIEPREIRAAILEDGEPINFFVERSTRKYQKGNIYRARVTSIEPHLQAAFVELEKGQHGFLSLSDVIFPDGGISLINGLPSPPVPEIEKKSTPREEPRKKELPAPTTVVSELPAPTETTEAVPTEDTQEPELFDDTPEFPVTLGPKPPLTSLSSEAGDWILGIGEPAVINSIVEEERSDEPEEQGNQDDSELQLQEETTQNAEVEAQQAGEAEEPIIPNEAEIVQSEVAQDEALPPHETESSEPLQVNEDQNIEAPQAHEIENIDAVQAQETENIEATPVQDSEHIDAETAQEVLAENVSTNESEHIEDSQENTQDLPDIIPEPSVIASLRISDSHPTNSLAEANDEPSDISPTDSNVSPAENPENSPVEASAEQAEAAPNPEEDQSAETCVDTAIFEIDSEESSQPQSEGQLSDEEGIDEDGLDEDSDDEKAQGDSTNRQHKGKRPFHKGGQRGAFAHKRRPHMRIENVLEIGQYITVQIIKEGIGNKAPMVSTFISLAGHYMVLTPGGDRSGVSKQVQSQSERSRLRTFIEQSKIPDRCGLIVRTAAENVDLKDLEQDIQHLSESWAEIQHNFKRTQRSGLIRKEEDLTTRLVRDYYNQDIDEVLIDDRETYEEIKLFFERGMSDQAQRVKYYEGERPIFYHYNLDKGLQGLFQRRVNLPGGGSLIFDQGEAMLVIDVNSGTFREGEDDEDTAFRLNLLACKEVARQVQMRDVGGIIMIDFVDMRRISNRNKVERELEKAFKGDKARLNVMSIGALGVLQMSRQRTKDSLRGSLYSPCPHCEATGLVPSKTHSAMGILREIRGNLRRFNGQQIKIGTTAEMAAEMFNLYKGELVKMEEEENCQIHFEIDNSLGLGQFKLLSKSFQRPAPVQRDHHPREQQAKEQNHNKSEASSSASGPISESEKRNKKKRKRNKNREEKTEQQTDSATDESGSMTNRLSRLEKEFPSEPLGVIKQPSSSEATETTESQNSDPSENQGEKASTGHQATESEGKSSDATQNTSETTPRRENPPPSAEPQQQASKENTDAQAPSEQSKSTKESSPVRYKGSPKNRPNNSNKNRDKNKAPKTPPLDLKKDGANQNPPPAFKAE